MKQLLMLALLGTLWIQSAEAGTPLKGVIRDANGEALAGASIEVKGTSLYAVADTAGHFILETPDQLPFVLLASFVGYEASEITISEIPADGLNIELTEGSVLSELFVTARRRSENIQDIPIAMTAVSGDFVADAGAFNVNRIKEVVPSVQLYSSNPRNTTLNIRGLGSTYGLTNDGVDPGVGFYVDGVYYSRPAATTLDFIDVERIEVLRGPQGTLFGKNTTAGAFNITSKKPSFKPGANFEVSYGNLQFVQAKASITGPLTKKVAARLSFSGTHRDGQIENIVTNGKVNTLSNIGIRAQVLYKPNDKIDITFGSDFTLQRPDGYAQVVAGVVTTKRKGYRQFDSIIADLGYSLPTENAFDRIIDHDTPWRSNQDMAGASANIDIKLGAGTLTSTTAYRYWKWGPSNDRDFTGLPVLSLSQAPSKHHQWSQELRYSGTLANNLTGVFGAFLFVQKLNTNPYHTEESGSAQWRFSQNTTSPLWETPGLLDGYGIRTTSQLLTVSSALFAQVDWEFVKNLHVLPGIRFNYDYKGVDYDRVTYGGLQTSDPALIAIQRSVYSAQAFDTVARKANFSGQLTVSYTPVRQINIFATYSNSFKPVGINLGGLPTAAGRTLTELAVIKPELVHHVEVGVKSTPVKNATLNVTYYNTIVKNYQTQVQTAEVGVNRGYLANAEKVRVQGVEVDASYTYKEYLSVFGNVAYTDGRYVTFTNAPVPLEETGAEQAFKDVSGEVLPGISKWAGSIGGEFGYPAKFFGQENGKYFVAIDGSFRTEFSSSPSPSKFLNIDGYGLMNLRLGYKAPKGFSVFAWSRNLLNKNYYEQLLPASGSAGHYAAVLGDVRTFGGTVRYNF